jgi:hypothetical protein
MISLRSIEYLLFVRLWELNMTKCLLILIILYGCSLASAQESAPKLLQDAAQCLAAKSFPSTNQLSLAYVIDARAYAGDQVIYVVEYTGASRSKGFVYTIFLSRRNGLDVLNIQNNAKFVTGRKGDYKGIDFVEPPLGGTWTQEQIAVAITRIEKEARFVVRPKELTPLSAFQCESYADRR